jgi:hypothetical protein
MGQSLSPAAIATTASGVWGRKGNSGSYSSSHRSAKVAIVLIISEGTFGSPPVCPA